MNDQLQKQLAEMLAKLTTVAQDAAKFAGDQIPPLVQEKIVFGRINETVQLIIVIAVLVWLYRTARTCQRHVTESDFDGWVFGLVASVIGATFAVVCACYQIEAALLVWFAPRLYIVEWLRGMVTK